MKVTGGSEETETRRGLVMETQRLDSVERVLVGGKLLVTPLVLSQ